MSALQSMMLQTDALVGFVGVNPSIREVSVVVWYSAWAHLVSVTLLCAAGTTPDVGSSLSVLHFRAVLS